MTPSAIASILVFDVLFLPDSTHTFLRTPLDYPASSVPQSQGASALIDEQQLMRTAEIAKSSVSSRAAFVMVEPAEVRRREPCRKCLVLIPVRNEAATIGQIIAGCLSLGATVWVIDNGSTDATPSAALAAGARVLTCSSEAGGKTAALRFGLSQLLPNAEWDWICFMDGDGQHRPEDLPMMMESAERHDADLIVGNRFPSSGTMPFARYWTNRLMSGFLNALSGGDAPDTQCGYRIARSSVLSGWLPQGRHYEFETELYLHAVRRGGVVKSVPIPTIYAGERSKIFWPRDALRFVLCVTRVAAASLGLGTWNGRRS